MIVTVVFATSRVQDIVRVELPAGSTIADAVRLSGVDAHYGLDPSIHGFAIFGRRAKAETLLAEGDRIELTRPLEADPKTARAKRAQDDALAPPLRRGKRPGGA